MSLDSDDVKAIAKLARLSIDEADVPLYATNLSNILDLVEQMNSVDTEGVVPMSHPLDVAQRLRDDVVTESDQRAVADDARTILSQGLRKDWFGDTKPFYQDLVALASKTAGGQKPPAAAQLVIALLIGLVALALGVFYFLRQSGADTEPPFIAITVGILIIIVAGLFAIKR